MGIWWDGPWIRTWLKFYTRATKQCPPPPVPHYGLTGLLAFPEKMQRAETCCAWWVFNWRGRRRVVVMPAPAAGDPVHAFEICGEEITRRWVPILAPTFVRISCGVRENPNQFAFFVFFFGVVVIVIQPFVQWAKAVLIMIVFLAASSSCQAFANHHLIANSYGPCSSGNLLPPRLIRPSFVRMQMGKCFIFLANHLPSHLPFSYTPASQNLTQSTAILLD